MGDRDWHALLDAHDAIVRVQLNRFRGREVSTSGDGFFAMFDGPQRAIRCAMAIRVAVHTLGIQVRAGLHTGECEVRGDDIGGIGVHIGARVSALAGPNDVLVSSTLRDLVIGSGLEFEERGSYELKGVPRTALLLRLHNEGLFRGRRPVGRHGPHCSLRGLNDALRNRSRHLRHRGQLTEQRCHLVARRRAIVGASTGYSTHPIDLLGGRVAGALELPLVE